jgi:nickel/cobalt transporter (NicO) family protein
MRRVLLLAVVIVPFTLVGRAADAHPLGNFTVNQYSGLRVEPGSVHVDLVVDMAEVPAYQARPSIDTDADGTISRLEGDAYRRMECSRITKHADLSIDGAHAALRTDSSRVSFPRGAAGLSTLRLECYASAVMSRGARTLTFANHNFEGRVGWREITATGRGMLLVASDLPTRSISRALTRYPDDLLSAPVDVREATIRFRPGGGTGVDDSTAAASSILPRGVDRATQAFVSLVARQDMTLAFALLAFGLAVGLGAIHALGPGHGKTVMAAYLVGQRGTLRQGVAIGLTVTATHTAGVLALGIALSTSSAFLPERLYPVLGLLSGAMLLSIGVGLLRSSVRRRLPHSHSHEHGGHTHVHAPPSRDVSRRNLVTMGFAGGLVPSPSALVVLLGAIALHRAWFGVLLVVAYGIGMAGMLTGAGLLLVRARVTLDNRRPGRRSRLSAAIPALSASVVCALGIVLTIRAAIAI